ncbi:MAG: DUF2474 domain-containing protein [Phenylobacterium sp.]|nr:hypothetical protein [Phenylobacterium sp.]TAJ71043.1 MAG: DUF2474 domain-containing protein [Phenylobacterium sp.]
MRGIIEPPPQRGEVPPPLWERLAWFAGLAITGAASCAAIAYALRLLLR